MPDDRTDVDRLLDLAAAAEGAAEQFRLAALVQDSFAAGLRLNAARLRREAEGAAADVAAEVAALLGGAPAAPPAESRPPVPVLRVGGGPVLVLRVGEGIVSRHLSPIRRRPPPWE